MLNSANLYSNIVPTIAGGVTAVTESPDAVFQHFSKSMNYYNHNNPPLKDDSGLTFNNNALPLPRKRPREYSSIPVHNDNCSLMSVPLPACEISGQFEDGSVSFLGDDLSLQMMQQQFEIDRLISIHMEKVRQEMEERRRIQSNRVIQTIQEAVSKKLKEKEDQIEKIGRLNWALESRIKSLCLENQVWRDLAQTNEATANALRLNLEQVISQANNNAVNNQLTDDAESCCGSSGDGCEEDDGGDVLRWRKVAKTSAGGERNCKRCGERESSVLLLPCRHLCLCSECGPAGESCPVCNSTKTASVHVNLC